MLFIQASVSFKRINKFMRNYELDPDSVTKAYLHLMIIFLDKMHDVNLLDKSIQIAYSKII